MFLLIKRKRHFIYCTCQLSYVEAYVLPSRYFTNVFFQITTASTANTKCICLDMTCMKIKTRGHDFFRVLRNPKNKVITWCKVRHYEMMMDYADIVCHPHPQLFLILFYAPSLIFIVFMSCYVSHFCFTLNLRCNHDCRDHLLQKYSFYRI